MKLHLHKCFYVLFTLQKLCPKVWLPSRLESDCILGDGLVLTFPHTACSPLKDNRLELRLQCWGSWHEDGFLFVVAGEPRKMAQVVFRFPQNLTGRRELTTKLFFSPVCPTERDESPAALTSVKQLDLLMNRTEPGICYDDSIHCQELAADGKCAIHALYRYANFCKRSCGLCNLLPSPGAECRFPEEFYGDWMIFSDRRQERVSIHKGHVMFSSLGEFVCKGKHWNRDQYKMLSYYSNGCRPRYSCLNFVKEYDETLQFRMSKSSLVDPSFRMCDFKDDPPPLDGAIRSRRFKTLLPLSKMDENVCGLNGIIRIRTAIQDGRVCQGTLSDWSARSCSSGSRLKLKLNGICPHKLRALTRNGKIAAIQLILCH
ncbi:hypothetical protein NP493_724g01016 [Ridgeia piscesae]|uniref:ShKT domain-containing protein n=1 Tax=Ridgeia piscesae TaxID=27915 RepID=A0AAD9KRX2_RIDPI|nr:hypothetical protein NP493_724g01016 [Ridgeia piscesae]